MWITSPLSPCVGPVLDLALDLGADGMPFGESLPRVLEGLLEAERDAALGRVHFEHLDVIGPVAAVGDPQEASVGRERAPGREVADHRLAAHRMQNPPVGRDPQRGADAAFFEVAGERHPARDERGHSRRAHRPPPNASPHGLRAYTL